MAELNHNYTISLIQDGEYLLTGLLNESPLPMNILGQNPQKLREDHILLTHSLLQQTVLESHNSQLTNLIVGGLGLQAQLNEEPWMLLLLQASNGLPGLLPQKALFRARLDKQPIDQYAEFLVGEGCELVVADDLG